MNSETSNVPTLEILEIKKYFNNKQLFYKFAQDEKFLDNIIKITTNHLIVLGYPKPVFKFNSIKQLFNFIESNKNTSILSPNWATCADDNWDMKIKNDLNFEYYHREIFYIYKFVKWTIEDYITSRISIEKSLI